MMKIVLIEHGVQGQLKNVLGIFSNKELALEFLYNYKKKGHEKEYENYYPTPQIWWEYCVNMHYYYSFCETQEF